MKWKAIIFDLDGVLVTTDEYHFLAWSALCERAGFFFDRALNERLRGVSRRESLQIILDANGRTVTEEEAAVLMEEKNRRYIKSIEALTPKDVLPGALEFCRAVRAAGAKLAVGSSSRNTKTILRNVGLEGFFDAVSDGTNVSRSKPFPDVFLAAAEMLGVPPCGCLVAEDADAGVEAARRAGMAVLALSAARKNPDADFCARSLKPEDIGAVLAQIMGDTEERK